MMEYFEEYTYFGPDREAKVAAANELVPRSKRQCVRSLRTSNLRS